VGHLEQALESKQQELLDVARQKRQLESLIRSFERQPPDARFGELFDGKEKLPGKLRVQSVSTVYCEDCASRFCIKLDCTSFESDCPQRCRLWLRTHGL
jgi:hypothetical protein